MKNFYKTFTAILAFSLISLGSHGQWAGFSYELSGTCEPQDVYIINTSDTSGLQGSPLWEWYIDGMFYDTYEPPMQVFYAGEHMVHLVLRDSYNDDLIDETSQAIYTDPVIDDFMITTGPEACPGEMVTFSIHKDYWSLQWDFGDSLYAPDWAKTQNWTDHTYNTQGTYDVTLIVDYNCGPDTITKQITITDSAVPKVEAWLRGSGMICPNDEVTFELAWADRFEDIVWDFGDGTTVSGEKSPSHYFDATVDSMFQVVVTATNACGNSNSDTVHVGFMGDIQPEPYFNWYYSGNQEYENPCPNTPVTFQAHGQGTYFWDFGDGRTSTEREPANRYGQPGTYPVSLTITNGCGYTASWTDTITVELFPSILEYTDIRFEMEHMDWDEQSELDTLKICPGELVGFVNEIWHELSLKYHWDFGDGTEAFTKEVSHVYNDPGIYKITGSVFDPCGGTGSDSLWVMVDTTRVPSTTLNVIPRVICSGDPVYFFDANYEPDESPFTYSIDFGDGEVMNNITSFTDTVLQVLAKHEYTGSDGDIFEYVFSATNKCGNSLDVVDTIRIDNNPGRKPFYYVNNSTFNQQMREPENWETRQYDNDHEMTIPIQWSDWDTTMNNTFFVFFWYGEFNPEYDPGMPFGYVEFTSDSIVTGDTVKAYIPINPSFPPMIGMAAGWSCTGSALQALEQGEPESWGMPMDAAGSPVYSFSIEPSGVSSILESSVGIQLQPWDGVCNSEDINRDYYYEYMPGNVIQLDIWEDEDETRGYSLYVTKDVEPYSDWITGISSGDYYLTGSDTIVFYNDYDCQEEGYYLYALNDSQIVITLLSDPCTERAEAMTRKPFNRQYYQYETEFETSGCPGDLVAFQIAGAQSQEWHFGDGATSTEQFVQHAYADTGHYDAFVIASNACGRTDTLESPVVIGYSNVPSAHFWMDKYNVPRLEEIQFFYEMDWYQPAQINYSFLWDFGDGTTSTKMNPVHAYTRSGMYTVTLTVTNGCGTNSQTQDVYIIEAELQCDAKFDFSIDGTTAGFTDLSWGEPTSWQWDFGDGTTSSQQNPVHDFSRDGVFYVCLSIYDSLTGCAAQICREVVAGVVNCRAGFTYTVNNTTKTALFNNESTNATEFFWDFGDGFFSPDTNPEHAYENTGIYTVCLGTYDSITDCYAEVCKDIQVGSATDSAVCFADFSFYADSATGKVFFTDKSSSNISSWYWTFGDGSFIQKRNPEHLYGGPGTYKVCLSVFDDVTGCTGKKCKEVKIGISECNQNADFSFFVDMETSTVRFNNKSTGNITNYFWNFGDETTSARESPSHQYTKAGYYLVALSVFDSTNDCKDHTAKFIQVGTVDCRSFFEYTFKGDTTSSTVQFYEKSRGNIADYFWDFDDGSYSEEQDPLHEYDRPGLYMVSLTVSDADGLCMDRYTEPIQVGTIDCGAEFTFFVDSATNVAYFTPKTVGDITDYLWFFGDGAVSPSMKAKHQYLRPGYFTVGLNTFDESTGCMDYYEDVLLIGSLANNCKAGFIYRSDQATREVFFTDDSRGDITDWLWNFGDGEKSTDQNPSHTYSKGGYYNVCLTVKNTAGITNSTCKHVQVAAPEECFARFMYSVDSATQTVDFVDNSYGSPDGWFWDFGDDLTSTLQNPSHTYGSPGFYMVHLSVANSNTNSTSNAFKLINVAKANEGIQVGFAYEADSATTKAEGYPVDFIGVSLGDANRFQWDFGDGNKDTTSLTPTHVYAEPGVYTVCLTISDPATGTSQTKCEDIETSYGVGIPYVFGPDSRLTNFPNPFRDHTRIMYTVPGATKVQLSLYDNTGRKIETLVDQAKPAGRYVIEYDGSGLSSGVYYLRMITGREVVTTKMVVK